MSSSFRSPGTPLRAVIGGLAVLACAGARTSPGPAAFIRSGALRPGEYDTHRALSTLTLRAARVIISSPEGWLKRLTLQTDMILHPQISYGNYPQLNRLNRVAACWT